MVWTQIGEKFPNVGMLLLSFMLLLWQILNIYTVQPRISHETSGAA